MHVIAQHSQPPLPPGHHQVRQQSPGPVTHTYYNTHTQGNLPDPRGGTGCYAGWVLYPPTALPPDDAAAHEGGGGRGPRGEGGYDRYQSYDKGLEDCMNISTQSEKRTSDGGGVPPVFQGYGRKPETGGLRRAAPPLVMHDIRSPHAHALAHARRSGNRSVPSHDRVVIAERILEEQEKEKGKIYYRKPRSSAAVSAAARTLPTGRPRPGHRATVRALAPPKIRST